MQLNSTLRNLKKTGFLANIPWVLLGILICIIMVPLIVGSNQDAEDYIFTIPSTVLQIRALLEGDMALWASQYGLGIPLPFSQHLNYHPMLPLFLFENLSVPILLLYFLHSIIGAIGYWRLIELFNIERRIGFICLYTFFLSGTTLNFFQSDFWPTMVVAWTLAPWIILAAFRFNLAETKAEAFFQATLIGFLTGFITINGHVGYVILFYFPTLVIILSNWRQATRFWAPLGLAIIVFLIMIAPKLIPLFIAHSEFPNDTIRTTEGIDLSGSSGFMLMWAFFFKPLKMLPLENIVNFDLSAIFSHLYQHNSDTWVLYYGNIFSIMTLIGFFVAFNSKSNKRALALSFLTVAILLFMPIEWFFQVLTANFLFRDPITLLGILLAGIAFTAAWQRFHNKWGRRIITTILVAHVLIVFITMIPVLNETWIRSAENGNNLSRLKDVTMAQGFIKKLQTTLSGQDHRIFLSERVNFDSRQYKMLPDGWVTNGPGLYQLNIVNGHFKGMSLDRVFPTENIMMGRIEGQDDLFNHPQTLSVLGVTHALIYKDERPITGWEKIKVFPISSERELHLYKNPTPWKRSTVLPLEAKEITLPKRQECWHNRMLCRDFSQLFSQSKNAISATTVSVLNGIDVKLNPSNDERFLVVSEYYHHAWRAYDISANGIRTPITIHPYQDGIIGITLPRGSQKIELRFERPIFWWSMALGYPAVIFAFFLVLYLRRQAKEFAKLNLQNT